MYYIPLCPQARLYWTILIIYNSINVIDSKIQIQEVHIYALINKL